ncbi:MAG: hypothetical protein WBF89_00095 [Steroidobacteraceae bacterium]
MKDRTRIVKYGALLGAGVHESSQHAQQTRDQCDAEGREQANGNDDCHGALRDRRYIEDVSILNAAA